MVKLCKLLFLILSIILLISVTCNNPNQAGKQDETSNQQVFSRKLMQEMGLDQPGKISKEVFKKFLYRLVTKDQEPSVSDNHFFNSLVKRLSDKVPDEFESKELEQFITPASLTSVFQEVIRENYGEEVYNELIKKGAIKKNDL
jgi:hypothetical protein